METPSTGWFSGFSGANSTTTPQDVNPHNSEHAGNYILGYAIAKRFQNRFCWNSNLNQETLAAIKDNSLVKSGTKNVVRFDSGAISGKNAHIDLDFRGYPNRKYGPVEVPSSVVAGAGYLQKTMQYVDPLLTAAAYGVEGYRMFVAGRQDCADYDEHVMKTQLGQKKQEKLVSILRHDEYALECYAPILEESFAPSTYMPTNTIRTGSSIAGTWIVGAAGAFTGTKIGTLVGGLAGAAFGPPGVLVGSVAGASVGAIGGGVTGAVYGASAGENAAEKLVKDGKDAIPGLKTVAGMVPELGSITKVLPAMPSMPAIPGLGSITSVLPEMSSIKNAIPAIPSIPSMPAIPGLDSITNALPAMPSIPGFGFNTSPEPASSPSALPVIPSMPTPDVIDYKVYR